MTLFVSSSEEVTSWEAKRREVYIRDKGICRYCLKGLSLYEKNDCHIDHVIPKSLMGTDDIKNLVASCAKCNLSKGQRTPAQAGMFLYEVPIIWSPYEREGLTFFDYLEWVELKYGPDENGSRIRRRPARVIDGRTVYSVGATP